MKERWQTIAPPPQPPHPQRESITAWVLVLAFLVSLVGSATMYLVIGALKGQKAPAAAVERARVQVPDLIGLPVAGARLQVEGNHLLLHLVGPAPEGPTDSARIVWQRPLAGSLVRADDAIEVGFRAEAAPQEEAATVVVVHEAPAAAAPAPTEPASAPAPAATTAATADAAPPDADEENDTGEAAEMVTVPHLARLDEDEARRRLEAVGLHGRFDSRWSPSVPTGRVILSRPGAGEAVARGGRVMVFVAE